MTATIDLLKIRCAGFPDDETKWPKLSCSEANQLDITDTTKLAVDGAIAATALSVTGTITAAAFEGDGSALVGLVKTTGDNTMTGSLTIQNNLTVNGAIRGNLADEAIKAEHLANNAVSTRTIQNNAVTSQAIQNGAITGVKLATDAVTGSKIVNGSISGAELADGAVSKSKVAAGAISLQQLDVRVEIDETDDVKASGTHGIHFESSDRHRFYLVSAYPITEGGRITYEWDNVRDRGTQNFIRRLNIINKSNVNVQFRIKVYRIDEI